MGTGTYTKDTAIEEIQGYDQTINIAGTPSNYRALVPGFSDYRMVCDTAWRLSLAPKILHVLYYDATDGSYTDYTTQATDGLSTTHVPLDAMATDDYLYIGTTGISWLYFDIGTNANAEAATLDMEYCSTAATASAGPTFSDVAADSDQTTNGGATLAIDGEYVFTKPASVRSKLGTLVAPTYSKCYWLRFKPSAALSATVDINEIIPVYPDATNLAYMSAATEYIVRLNPAKVGGWYAQCSAEKHLYFSPMR